MNRKILVLPKWKPPKTFYQRLNRLRDFLEHNTKIIRLVVIGLAVIVLGVLVVDQIMIAKPGDLLYIAKLYYNQKTRAELPEYKQIALEVGDHVESLSLLADKERCVQFLLVEQELKESLNKARDHISKLGSENKLAEFMLEMQSSTALLSDMKPVCPLNSSYQRLPFAIDMVIVKLGDHVDLTAQRQFNENIITELTERIRSEGLSDQSTLDQVNGLLSLAMSYNAEVAEDVETETYAARVHTATMALTNAQKYIDNSTTDLDSWQDNVSALCLLLKKDVCPQQELQAQWNSANQLKLDSQRLNTGVNIFLEKLATLLASEDDEDVLLP